MKYRIHEEVICETIGDLYFLVAYGRAQEALGFMIAINDTGAFYWKLLEEHKDSEEILSLAAEAYGLHRDQLREGMERFLEDLCDRGYINPV